MSGKRVALIAMYDEQALGIRCLSNALIEAGHSVVVIHFKLNQRKVYPHFLRHTDCYQVAYSMDSNKEIGLHCYASDVSPWATGEPKLLKSVLKTINPDIVGLATRSVYAKRIKEITDEIVGPDWITVVGGHDASFRPDFYKRLGFDYVCQGDGEEFIVDIADHGVPTSLVPRQTEGDFLYKKDSNVSHFLIDNHSITRIDPYAREFEPQLYYTMLGRGCVGNCSFCSSGKYIRLHYGWRPRIYREIKTVIRELKNAKKLNFTRVFFLDSYLVGPKDYLLEFFKKYKKKVGIPFFAQLDPRQVVAHPEILDAAVDAGLYQTVTGFQSGSEWINREIFNRPTSHNTLMKFSQMCVDKGVEVHYHFITHNPFEATDDHRKTFDLIGELPYGPGCAAAFRPLNVFPNTELHTRILSKDVPSPFSFDEYCQWLTLYMLKFKRPEISFDDYKDKTISELNRAYLEAPWNLR